MQTNSPLMANRLPAHPSLRSSSVRILLAAALSGAIMAIPAISSAASACDSVIAPIGPGASGPSVATLQRCLVERGTYTGAISGTYGPQTTAAVQRFQAARGIVSSGSPATTGYGAVGARTLTALRGSSSTIPQPILDMLGRTVNSEANIGWKTVAQANIELIPGRNSSDDAMRASVSIDMLHNADTTARGSIFAEGTDGSESQSLELLFAIPDQERAYLSIGKRTKGGFLDDLDLRRVMNRWYWTEWSEGVRTSVSGDEESLVQRVAAAQRAHPALSFVEQGSDSTVVRYAFSVNQQRLPAFLGALAGSDEPLSDDELPVDYIRGTIAIHRMTSELVGLTINTQVSDDDGTIVKASLSTQTQRLSSPANIRRPARSRSIETLFEELFEGPLSTSRTSTWTLP